jgi:hypothetical protein
MTVMMSENQSCRSQVHVTVFQSLRVKHQKVGLNRRLKVHTAGGGGHGSHNHVIGKRTVNTTLTKVITPTRHTARNLQHFSHDCRTPNIHIHYYFLTGEEEYSQDRFPAIH